MNYMINCLIVGNTLSELFKINVKRGETVMGLKKIILEEQNFDDLSFKLWKVDIPFCGQDEKLIKLIADCFNIREDLEGLEMKNTDNIDLFKLFLNNDEKSIHILVESRISFKICTEKMELVQNDTIVDKNSSTKGLIKFTPKGFKIVVNNELEFSSFKEFIQQTKSNLHKKSSKENLKIYIHELDIMLDWPTFRLRVLHERKINRGLRKLCKDLGDLEAKAVPEVGDRKIQHISDGGMAVASVLFAEEYAKSDVHLRKVSAKFKGFPVIIGYGTFEPLYRNRHDTLSSGVSIGDLSISSTATLGAFFKTTSRGLCTTTEEKRYIITVDHAVGEGSLDDSCATIKCKSFKRNERGCLLDYAFCEINNNRNISEPPYKSHIAINGIKDFVGTDLKSLYKPEVPIQKIGRTTGHTEGSTRDYLYTLTNFSPFNFVKAILVLDEYGDAFSAKGDSGSPVFDENGILWGILHGRNENHGSCAVVPINEILDDARQNGMDFRLM
ncbi:unnamed protein product [Rhizophagus irregularis]|uniref:Crinkler effector protein N-terminal domain-containing protein n=1 Tax=Rhizophagus irregularis TaxID=588596 RepID=A0A915ZQ03_9GLOM|nr:unnamed protein product [Rhizophagus irregularis]CAB5386532.1 unnamed protein product [Rhizophagus irregularis]